MSLSACSRSELEQRSRFAGHIKSSLVFCKTPGVTPLAMAEFGFFSAVLVAAVLHGAHAVRSHDAISMNAASLEGTASEFCDVDAENQKKQLGHESLPK